MRGISNDLFGDPRGQCEPRWPTSPTRPPRRMHDVRPASDVTVRGREAEPGPACTHAARTAVGARPRTARSAMPSPSSSTGPPQSAFQRDSTPINGCSTRLADSYRRLSATGDASHLHRQWGHECTKSRRKSLPWLEAEVYARTPIRPPRPPRRRGRSPHVGRGSRVHPHRAARGLGIGDERGTAWPRTREVLRGAYRIRRREVGRRRGVRPPRGLPRLGDATPDAESGRGLAIVEAFAEAWGVRERIVGKTVWARVRL